MRCALFAVCFILACAPRSSPSPSTPEPTQADLLGMMQTVDGLTLQLRSGGCRGAGDVTFDVVDDALVITNLEPDECEASIELGETVSFTWAELPGFRTIGFGPGAVPVREPAEAPGATEAPAEATEEPIYGVLFTNDGLDVRVSTGGCTTLESFTSWLEPGEPELVHLVRTRMDGCDAFIPEGVVLHFTWAQLGVTKDRARLVNPIHKLPL